ncbi:MAG TPA: hypothetical protein VEX35_05410 [Allosphingosinicella sp.]|nr:hypothetical protein [Allosphingosinicella sp.]
MIGTNSDIYDKRLMAASPWGPFRYVPYSLYFYYVRLDRDSRLRVDHYFYVDGPPEHPEEWKPIPPDRVAAIVAGLAANARAGGSNPPPSGANFQDIVWTRKSHLAILIDEEGWALQRRADGGTAIAFNRRKGSTPNHSFFDARDLEVEISGGSGGTGRRSAIALINHMKRNSDGEDLLEGEAQPFVFDVYVDVRYSGSPGSAMTVILDPDGTNMGPPLGPP